jgi:hypothetical protein
MINGIADRTIFVIPASRSEAEAQVIEHNHAFGPGIQKYELCK